MDILTFQVGYGLGAKARVGRLQTGLLADIGAIGIRGGEVLGFKDFWPEGYDQPAKQDYVGVLVGREAFGGNDISNRRGKSFGAKQVLFASYPMTHPEPYQQAWLDEHHMVLNPAPYYSQIEVVAAAGLSLRIGFNPGELLDFLLGWFGVDIYHDDLSRAQSLESPKANRRCGKPPHIQGPTGSKPQLPH